MTESAYSLLRLPVMELFPFGQARSSKTVRSAYQVTVYVDNSGNLTIVQNPTITSVPVKSGYTPKAVQSDGTVDSITTEEINEFLTTFFKLYPTAIAKELTYYVNEGVLKPVGKEYIFSELVNPVYNRNGNQVTFRHLPILILFTFSSILQTINFWYPKFPLQQSILNVQC